jgi:hypothetical protein
MKTLLTGLVCLLSYVLCGQDVIMIDGNPCGPHGSSQPGRKEYDLNVLKNRYRIPSDAEIDKTITLDKLVGRTATKTKFSADKAVEVIGYVYDVKVGGVESCNCKATIQLFRDTHIEITLGEKKTGPGDRLIAEVTPRIRQMVAKNGEDWTTHNLKLILKGRMVKIRGWLLYDAEHEDASFADDPKNEIGHDNWRASSWEIHPVTSLEILDPPEEMPTKDGTVENSIDVPLPPPPPLPPAPPGPVENKPVTTNNVNPPSNQTNQISSAMETTTPFDLLAIILIGAILGGVGQGIRVIVGIKKVNDEALKKKLAVKELLEYKQILLSLVIGFAIGAVAGVLAAVSAPNIHLTKTVIFAFLGAGYAGTDFIEGFIKKNPLPSPK